MSWLGEDREVNFRYGGVGVGVNVLKFGVVGCGRGELCLPVLQYWKGFFERQVFIYGCRGTQGEGADEEASV